MRTTLATLATGAIIVAACAAPSLTPGQPRPEPGPPVSTVPSGSAAPRAASAPLTKGDAWVAVSVATVWRSRTSPRKVDGPALANPARIQTWLSRMTTAQRRALNGRADTQALLGDRVRIVRLRPGWAKVAVPDQPTPADSRGYPGWVPRRQLTATQPMAAATKATVISRLAWLREDRAGGARTLRVSFGTRLPVVGTTGSWVRVAVPTGEVRRVRAAQVSVHAPQDPALPATRAGLVVSATSFVGLDYLWAGRSGFGFDCSGLTSLVYRVHGVRIPRDASPQSTAGRGVTRVRRGDLLFYADSGGVHHVSMAVGNGRMVHAPRTGSTVQVIPRSTPAYAQEYAGARRFL